MRPVQRSPGLPSIALALAAAGLLAACGRPAAEQPSSQESSPVPAVPVAAVVETVVPDNPTVDADDPVLWADPADPSRGLLIGTDKSIGLYVHDLNGRMLQFFPAGPLNNVDRRPFPPVAGRPVDLVAAAERAQFGIAMWLLDHATARLVPYGFFPTPRAFGEPYGFCMGSFGGRIWLIANNKAGEVLAFTVTPGNPPEVQPAHRWKVSSQTEGCVVDDSNGDLWLGEEDVGIWRMSLADPARAPRMMAAVDNVRLVADVEGLTLMRDAGHTFLIASSQGDSSYAVWRVDGGRMLPAGRFRIAGRTVDPVTQTDGLDAWSGPIGRWPAGAIAFHDHCDGPGRQDPPAAVCNSDAKQQNYKIVDWRSIKTALGL